MGAKVHDTGNIPTAFPAGYLANLFANPARVVGVIGGHYVLSDRVAFWKTPATGQLALYTDIQNTNYYVSPWAPANPSYYGWVTVLEYFPISNLWCTYDQNFLTFEQQLFQPYTCRFAP